MTLTPEQHRILSHLLSHQGTTTELIARSVKVDDANTILETLVSEGLVARRIRRSVDGKTNYTCHLTTNGMTKLSESVHARLKLRLG